MDIAAVVQGLRAGGATEILVVDGHGTGASYRHLMTPGAKYLTGRPRRILSWLDASVAGLVMLAHHADERQRPTACSATPSVALREPLTVQTAVESGELAQVAAVAGHYGRAAHPVTGNEAACRESQKFFGKDCVTVAVKRGVSRESAVLYPFAETRAALAQGARPGDGSPAKCKPYRLTLPIKAKMEYLQADAAGKSKLVNPRGNHRRRAAPADF